MKKFLHPGINVFQNDNGDYVVHFDRPLVTIKDKTYNSTDAFLSDLYHTVFTTLSTLISESQELKGDTTKHTKPLPNTPAFHLVPVKELDGQTTWVRQPVPHKKQGPANNGYVWNPTDVQQPATPPATKTYGVTPTPAQAGQSTETSQEYTPPVTPQSSTYVAPVYHAEMLKPGEALSDVQLARLAFPGENENFAMEIVGNVEYRNLSREKELDINPAEIQEQKDSAVKIITVSHTENGQDIGVLSSQISDTEKDVFIDNSGLSIRVHEHREYAEAGTGEVNGMVETREVYIDYGDWQKKVVYQYRTGINLSVTKPLAEFKKLGINAGLNFKATSDWKDLPIPEQGPPEPPQIQQGGY